MSQVVFTGNRGTLKGTVAEETPKAIRLSGKFGPVLVPLKFVSHVVD